MIRLFGHYIPRSIFWLGLGEVGIVLLSIFGAVRIRFALAELAPPGPTAFLVEELAFALIFYLVALAVGLYHRETCRDLRMTIVRLLVSIVLAFVAMSVIFYVFPDVEIWRSIFAIAFPILFLGIVAARVVFLQIIGREAFKTRILVLGAGKQAKRIRDLAAVHNGPTDFVIVDFLRMGEKEKAIPDATPVAEVGDIHSYVKDKNIDEIVTAMEERRGSLPIHQLLACKLAGVPIRDYSTFMERETGVVELETLSPSWIVYADRGARGTADEMIKRGFDISVSLLLLVFTLPILVVTAAAVKLTSRGPVFYRQERVGFGNRPFMLLKFRSMVENAEAEGTPQWAQENDPRVTKVGRFIRHTRIDELPQIFNVLKGDMSFVGPRPERPYFVESLSCDLPYYAERHAVKPGITGWAQLNHSYGASAEDAHEKLQYDLYYIKNYSLFLDFLILVQTVRVILFPTGYAR